MAFHGTHTEDHLDPEEKVEETVYTNSTDEDPTVKDCMALSTYTHTLERDNVTEVAEHPKECPTVVNTGPEANLTGASDNDRNENRKKHPYIIETGEKPATAFSRESHDNKNGCAAPNTDFGVVPGIGIYVIILSRSVSPENYTKNGIKTSDTGIGSGTPVTVVVSPGVKKIAGADTDV